MNHKSFPHFKPIYRAHFICFNGLVEREELIKLDKNTLIETIVSLQRSVDELLKNNELLLEALKLSKQRIYGKKSEVNNNNQLTLDLFFNEPEALYDENINEPSIEETVQIRKKKKKGKREKRAFKDY